MSSVSEEDDLEDSEFGLMDELTSPEEMAPPKIESHMTASMSMPPPSTIPLPQPMIAPSQLIRQSALLSHVWSIEHLWGCSSYCCIFLMSTPIKVQHLVMAFTLATMEWSNLLSAYLFLDVHLRISISLLHFRRFEKRQCFRMLVLQTWISTAITTAWLSRFVKLFLWPALHTFLEERSFVY